MARRGQDRIRAGTLERLLLLLADDPDAVEGLVGDLIEEIERRPPPRGTRWLVLRWRLLGVILKYRRPTTESHGGRPIRDAPRASVWSRVARSFLHAARGLRRDRAVLTAAILTLALGVGAATAVYAVVASVLARDLPYRDPDRLLYLRAAQPGEDNIGVIAEETYLDIQEGTEASTWEGVGPEALSPFEVDGELYGLSSAYVTPGLFPLLGIEPILGRHFVPEDVDEATASDATNRVLLSHAAWQRIFGGDADAVGTKMSVHGLPWVVIGVLPEEAKIWLGPGTSVSPDVDVFWPYQPMRGEGRRQVGVLRAIGRLTPGAPLPEAQGEIERVADSLRQVHPEVYGDTELRVVPLQEDLVQEVEGPLGLLGALVLTVLMIAAGNAAGLLLARGRAREVPAAIKQALGAGPRQLGDELLAEALLLAAMVGVTGLTAARGLFQVLVGTAPASIPRIQQSAFDPAVILTGIGLAVLTTLLATLLPALQHLAVSPQQVLQTASSRFAGARLQLRTRGALVVLQVALSLILLLGAGLLARSFVNLTGTGPGFDPDSLLLLEVQDHDLSYVSEEPWEARSKALVTRTRQARDAIVESDGVVSVSLASAAPFGDWPISWTLYGSGEIETPDPDRRALQMYVAPGYFDAMGIRLIAGRDFEWRELGVTATQAILTEDIARSLWPDGHALGRTLSLGSLFGTRGFEVVGVAESSRVASLRDSPTPQIYIPSVSTNQTLIVRTEGKPEAHAPAIRRRLREAAPWLSVSTIETMGDRLVAHTAESRFTAVVVSALAVTGLLLTCAGLFAMAAYMARTRRRETAIRMALGASGGDIVYLGVREASRYVLPGVSLGVLVGLWAGRMIEGLLHGVTATDELVLLGAPTLIVLVSLAAAALPAITAARRGARGLTTAD